jgi:hypothetical protein
VGGRGALVVRSGWAALLAAVVLLGAACGSSTSSATGAAATSYTGTIVGVDSGVLSIQVSAADKPGGVNGVVMRGRITERTTLVGIARDGTGSSGLPVTFVAPATANADGTYDLISVFSQRR